ncbi:MAG TPA: LssY C-terminal domain-containing protein [Bryobacteraceae bacterium]|nr:LssY C-terminal domain-containing protein [Bryobacteraceae bacterium]
MITVLGLLFSITALATAPVPEGTELHVRLTTTVGSYASRAGSPIRAVLIAPVTVDGETILQPGSTLSGMVKAVTRVGLGVRHETAGLDLDFSQFTSLDGESVPISTQVTEVDNGRERVARDGRIQGVRATSSMSYRVGGYIRTVLQWEVHAELAEWAIRSLLVQLPEPEIYYPSGVELTLKLTRLLLLDSPRGLAETEGQLTAGDRGELADLVADMPYRTHAPSSGRSSDLTNVLFIGSHDQIVAAFAAAGWMQAHPPSLRHRINWIRAVAELRGDGAAPMSPLLLNGAEPDMSWQKGLNDVSKRHHIRMWRDTATWRGREMWIGAATRDIDFAYLRPGSKLTHRIDEEVDEERDKVAYDLAFTSCGNVVDWTDRADSPRSARNATGDPIVTDGRMVVVELTDCAAPRLSTETVDLAAVPAHGDKLQRFARREILSARNELFRGNPYWRGYEGIHWMVDFIRRDKEQTPDPELLNNPPFSGLAQFVRFATARMQ